MIEIFDENIVCMTIIYSGDTAIREGAHLYFFDDDAIVWGKRIKMHVTLYFFF